MYACENEDSCEPGTEHAFPDLGESVTVIEPMDLREIGAYLPHVAVVPGEFGTVVDIHPETHEVIAEFHGSHVWLAIEDVEGLEAS